MLLFPIRVDEISLTGRNKLWYRCPIALCK